MRITPAAQDGSAVWAHEGGDVITLGVWTEKKPGRGEDCEPLVLHHESSGLGMLAVCDGVGGAGVQLAGRTRSGTERSGAWVSSRAVRLALEQYFLQQVDSGPPGLETAGPPSLRESIDRVLQQLRNPARSRIGGTMQRELPSTLAAIVYRLQAQEAGFRVRWAGDSRCYLLTPAAGLQQLSRDDTETPDALSSLEQDPPMTNQIAADRRYDVHNEAGQVPLPCVLVCATDGFFNYVQTPAHFEYILLDTLARSPGTAGWGELLAREVQGYTQDDASLAIVALGYRELGDLRAAFAARLAAVRADHWVPLQGLAAGDLGAYRAARLDSWQRYRPGYEQRIPQRPEERG
jgi:serine/threonine protein phosphatase PrpC